MPRKSKTLILISVVAGVLVAVALVVPSRPEAGAHYHDATMKMEGTRDSNGVWWYRAATNTQQAAR